MSHTDLWRDALAAHLRCTVASFRSTHYGPCLRVWHEPPRSVVVRVPEGGPTAEGLARLAQEVAQ